MVLFIQKGVTVKGDMIKITEMVMDDLSEATEQGFDDSYDPNDEENSKKEDTEQIKIIIKSQTSDDVFEQFGSGMSTTGV